jgi:uncharacterized membrane protein YesL
LTLVIAVDVVAATHIPAFRLLIGFLVVVVALVVAIWLMLLASPQQQPKPKWQQSVKTAAYTVARSPVWTCVSLLALVVLGYLFTLSPVTVLCFATSPVLYLVWSNCRHSLSRSLALKQTAA